MSPRKTTEPTTDERGNESHPSFGMIEVNRSHGGNSALFDSDILHSETVWIRIYSATRKRDLHSDYKHADRQFVEIEMSQSQWAAFVSSMGIGGGVPCTIRFREGEGNIPDAPYKSRLALSIEEVRTAVADAIAEVSEAFDTFEGKRTNENLRSLKYKIANLPSNMAFAGTRLTEHAEDTVTKAKVDIETMVLNKANQLGLEPGDLGIVPQLGTGEED